MNLKQTHGSLYEIPTNSNQSTMLFNFQATTYVKARILQGPTASQGHSSVYMYAKSQYNKYQNGELSRVDYISRMGHKFKTY